MDWITFMEKKQAEIINTGHIMDDETYITHLLNSLQQNEYEGAILVIKDKLRKGTVEIPENRGSSGGQIPSNETCYGLGR